MLKIVGEATTGTTNTVLPYNVLTWKTNPSWLILLTDTKSNKSISKKGHFGFKKLLILNMHLKSNWKILYV